MKIIDSFKQATTNPKEVMTEGGLFPLGGPEESSKLKDFKIYQELKRLNVISRWL